MSEIKRQDFFSDDLIQAPLVLASNMEKVLAVAKQIAEEMSKLGQEVKAAKTITDLSDATKKLNDNQKEFEKLQAQIQQAQMRTSDEYIKHADALAAVKEQQRKAAEQAKLNRQIAEAQEGSIKKLELQLRKNRLSYEQMSKAERENTEAGRQLLKTIQEQDEEYKKLKSSIGQNQANVGNYTQSIIQAIAPLKGLTGGLGSLSSGLTGSIGGINSFGMALKSIPIFAVISAISSLVSYFTKTEDGAMKLKVIMAGVSAVFDTVVDYLIALGRALSELTWDKFVEGIKGFGNTIKDFVIGRVEILLSGIKGIGTAFKLLFKGEFKEAAKTAGEAMLNIARSTTPVGWAVDAVVNTVEKLGPVASKVYEDIKNRVNANIDAQRMENQLIQEKRKFLIREAELQRDIAEASEAAADATLDDVSKLKALEEAEAKLNQLFAERIKIKERENEIAKIRGDLFENDIAANDAAAQREAELISIRAERAQQLKGLTKQISALRKKIEEDDRKAQIDSIKKVNEEALAEVQSRLDREVQAIQNAAIAGNITRAEAERQINELKKQMSDDLIQTQIEGLKKLLGFEKLTADERAEIQKKLVDLERQYSDALFQQLQDQPEEIKNNWKEKLEEISGYVIDFVGRVSDLFKSASDRRIAALDAEIAKIDENAKRELMLAGDNEEAKQAIQERAEANRQKLEKRRRRERQEQARIEKAAAIIEATIATALAVVKALPNIPLSVLVGALGAAQIAAIARQPIPQFAEGTDSAPGGPAIVGELGPEIIRERSGRTYLTPGVPTLMNVPRGAQVIPTDKTLAALATINYIGGRQALQEEIAELKKVIKDSDNRIVEAIIRSSPDIIRQGSILYEVKKDLNGNKQLLRKSIF